jgi:hypothetical protein
MVTINQRLDFDQIELLLEEFGFRAVREEEYGGDMEEDDVAGRAEDLCRGRPSSRSWATSTTARRRCSTTSARRT